MKPTVYLETTIPSYLMARPSRDHYLAAHQQITREWWDRRRAEFDLFISRLVLDECAGGDPGAAAARLTALAGIPELQATDEAIDLGRELFSGLRLPERPADDALHIATAAVHGIAYLLTWNCSHLANAALRERIEQICRDRGRRTPIICTPEELLTEVG